jgi:hypothetical protein
MPSKRTIRQRKSIPKARNTRMPFASRDTTLSATRNSSDKLPFSPRFRTKMHCAFVGTLPSGTATNGYFYVSGNSAHVPFNSTMVAATRTINYYSASGYSGESYSTVQPEGFSAICSATAPYHAYRVHGSKMALTFNPTSTADNLFASITAAQTGTNSTTTIWTSSQAPFASRLGTFTSIEQAKPIVKALRTAHVWGQPESAITADDGYGAAYNGSPGNEWCWVIQWQIVDNTTSNAVMGIRIEMTYDIEFYAPASGGLPDVLYHTKLLSEPSASGAKDNSSDEEYVPVLSVAEFHDLTTEELIIRSVLLARERDRAKATVLPDEQTIKTA